MAPELTPEHQADRELFVCAVRTELANILASEGFRRSQRISEFLRYVVEQTLRGNAGYLKEQVLAQDLYGRGEALDITADSIVRVDARRLRDKLREYYSDGRDARIRIAVPKGTYVPVFETTQSSEPSPQMRDTMPAAAPAPSRFRVRWIPLALTAAALACSIPYVSLMRVRPAKPLPARLLPLTSDPELEMHPSLSPDGSYVAFSWKGDIFVKEVEGMGLVQVTKDSAADLWPSWSPDGRQIAFIRQNGVFLVSPLGGGERRVAESLSRPVWTRDGSGLFVTLASSPYARSIFLVSLANGEKRRLTFPPDLSTGDVDMEVSPNGQMLAFYRAVHTEAGDIHVVPLTGGNPRRVTSDYRWVSGLAWTPDGTELIFSSDRRGWHRLWRVAARPAAGRGAIAEPQLVKDAGDDALFPSLSRPSGDGRMRMVYQRYTRNFDILRAEVSGKGGASRHGLGPSAPVTSSTRLEAMPSFSPDGKKIAFASDRSGAQELWICDLDGANPVRLTSFGGPPIIGPRWSPEGQRLVFDALTGPDGKFESFTIGAGGGTPQRVSALGGFSVAHPVFSRDGRWLYFIPGPMEGAVEAFKMPAGGGSALRITRNGAFRPEESLDGKHVYYGKFNTPGLWSIPVRGGEERRILDSITGKNWTVTARGIYYFDFAVPRGARKLVKFLSFETGRIDLVGTVESTVSSAFSGISVSPDGRWLAYSHVASTTSDLMLVDNFQ